MQSLCLELQLEESVDDLMQQLGADAHGHISYAQFLLCHKNIQLTPSQLYQDPIDTIGHIGPIDSIDPLDSIDSIEYSNMEDPPPNEAEKVFRRRDPKNGSGKEIDNKILTQMLP